MKPSPASREQDRLQIVWPTSIIYYQWYNLSPGSRRCTGQYRCMSTADCSSDQADNVHHCSAETKCQ